MLAFPFLFLPNFNVGLPTQMGTLELSDYLIGPYIILLLCAGRPKGPRLLMYKLVPLLLAFFGWAFVCTALIPFRYDYESNLPLYFSFLKLAKFTLYATAGVLTGRAVASLRDWRDYDWALLTGAVVLSVSLLMMREYTETYIAPGERITGFKSANAVSVMLGMFIIFLGARYVSGYGSRAWRTAFPWLIGIVLLGFTLSKGRAGWAAALVATGYLSYHLGLHGRVFQLAALGAGVGGVAYAYFPEFQQEVDKTLWPDPKFLAEYGAGIAGIDEGGRLQTWAHESGKFIDSPLLGTGFFHRGGESGLWSTGSHNSWLQFFLELGLPGGLLVLLVLLLMWQHAGTAQATAAGYVLSMRAALVVAFIGGLGEAYFYGGIMVFSLFSLYAAVGSTQASSVQPRVVRPHDPEQAATPAGVL